MEPPSLIAKRYELASPHALGAGGFGAVWAYRDLRLGRRVAIKLVTNPDVRVAPLEEVRRAASFQHPNIVFVHDVIDVAFAVGETLAPRAFVMEFVNGPSLAKLLKDPSLWAHFGPPTPQRAMSWALQISRALEHAHHREDENGEPAGVLHGDLHIGNVLMHSMDDVSDPVVKVTDWGTSTLVREYGPGLGNIYSTAPEAWTRAGRASDYWALGLLLCQVATGRSLASSWSMPPGRPLSLEARRLALVEAAMIESRIVRELTAYLLEPDPDSRAGAPAVKAACAELLAAKHQEDSVVAAVETALGPTPDIEAKLRAAAQRARRESLGRKREGRQELIAARQAAGDEVEQVLRAELESDERVEQRATPQQSRDAELVHRAGATKGALERRREELRMDRAGVSQQADGRESEEQRAQVKPSRTAGQANAPRILPDSAVAHRSSAADESATRFADRMAETAAASNPELRRSIANRLAELAETEVQDDHEEPRHLTLHGTVDDQPLWVSGLVVIAMLAFGVGVTAVALMLIGRAIGDDDLINKAGWIAACATVTALASILVGWLGSRFRTA